SFRKIKSGKWQATVYHPSGRRITHTDPLKRAVEAWARDQESRFRSGQAGSLTRGRRVTVEAWWREWQDARDVESATQAKNNSHWRNHIQPRWGAWPLETVAASRLEVQKWVKAMTRAGVGAPTV